MLARRALLAATLTVSVVAAPHLARAQEPSLPAALQIDLGGVTLDLVLVPAGTFVEGSPPTEKGREDGEAPREVQLTQPYYLGKYPVTVAQFTRFTAATGYRTEAELGTSGGSGWDGHALVQRKEFTWKNPGFHQGADHPVTLVTFGDAQAFAEWARAVANRSVWLPTEAQWEHAYRAGTKGAYYEGAAAKDALALGWFKENAAGGTHPVGQKKPNALGLYDMAGNVFEWCADWYAPYAAGNAVDPQGAASDPSDKPRRVLRGGSWLKDASHGRAAARARSTPGSRNADNGFRVAAATQVIHGPVQTPSDPPRDVAAPRAAPEASSGCQPSLFTVTFTGIVGVWAVMFVGILSRIFTRRRGAQAAASPPIRFSPGPDGFRIFAPPSNAGWTLVYRAAGQTGQVVLEPSQVGQFVYTGSAPSAIEVVQLVLPKAGARAISVVRRRSSQGVPDDDESGFRGFPSAY